MKKKEIVFFIFCFIALLYTAPALAKRNIYDLPALIPAYTFKNLVAKKINPMKHLSYDQKKFLIQNISRYLAFLNPEKPNETLKELLISSTQFLICNDFNDWSCLERKPLLKPAVEWRQDAEEHLGDPISSGEKLELDVFFGLHFNTKSTMPSSGMKIREIIQNDSTANELAKRILQDGTDAIAMAIYGIDETNESLKPVFDAILTQKNNGSNVRAVFDVDGIKSEEGKQSQLDFQYYKNGGTLEFIEALNSNANNFSQEQVSQQNFTRARLEWPFSDIMHNKFLVLTDKLGHQSIWTGTSNISSTCMGIETNTNMSIYLKKNNYIAAEYLKEFNEMFGDDEIENEKNFYKDSPEKQAQFMRENKKFVVGGKFHKNKTPNTKRYFIFDDGTELSLHFSPTDDGAHRSILPILLSAEKGDIIRTAMFGNGGLEYVRAFQYAAAQGAKIQIVLDGRQAGSGTSWYSGKEANLLEKNPFNFNGDAEPIKVLRSPWPGQNHLKVTTITKKGNAEIIILGSQNWSDAGNNSNDENMISIRNSRRSISAAEKFNAYFDQAVWAVANGDIPLENKKNSRQR